MYVYYLFQKLCKSSTGFVSSFENIFPEFYRKIHTQNKDSIENTAKLYAYLLTSNIVTWEVLSNLRLSAKETVTRRIFIEILLKEMSEHIGIEKLKKQFKKK